MKFGCGSWGGGGEKCVYSRCGDPRGIASLGQPLREAAALETLEELITN